MRLHKDPLRAASRRILGSSVYWRPAYWLTDRSFCGTDGVPSTISASYSRRHLLSIVSSPVNLRTSTVTPSLSLAALMAACSGVSPSLIVAAGNPQTPGRSLSWPSRFTTRSRPASSVITIATECTVGLNTAVSLSGCRGVLVEQEADVGQELPGPFGLPPPSSPGLLSGAWGRAVAADGLAVRADHLAGAVGVDDELPAHLVQQDVVVPAAPVLKSLQSGVPATIGAVHHVVRFALGRWLVAAAKEGSATPLR